MITDDDPRYLPLHDLPTPETAGLGPACMTVVQALREAGADVRVPDDVSKWLPGSADGGTQWWPGTVPHVIVGPNTDPEILAHELGHIRGGDNTDTMAITVAEGQFFGSDYVKATIEVRSELYARDWLRQNNLLTPELDAKSVDYLNGWRR